MALKGICITVHDSQYWPQFNTAYPIFQRVYPGFKATFYMEDWAEMSGTVKTQMLAAQAAGIEIANSTDIVAATYLETHTAQEYYDDIVVPNAADMVAGGINSPTSFAFNTGEAPRGLINTILSQGGDTKILIRKTGGILSNISEGVGFYKNIYPVGDGGVGMVDANIDIQRSCFDENYFSQQIQYCKDNNDVILYAAHAIEPTQTQSLSMLYSTLHKISRQCVCNGLNFYTVNDLLQAGIIGTERSSPTVSLIIVTGTQSSGNNLTATYTYQHPNDTAQSGTTFQWYRADDAIGTNAASIGGATSLVYGLTGADTGKFVRIGITPRTATQTGYETFTKWFAIS